jgi:phage/plasmid-associated DNA primase
LFAVVSQFFGLVRHRLSIVVGEQVLIRQKYKDAFPVQWKSGGMAIGNVPAAWKDKRGAYSRRLIYNRFDYAVRQKDGELEKKCVEELPRIILKMTRAFLSLVKWMDEKGETDIEQVWPSMYKLNITKFQGDNDMLMAFLKSGQLEFGQAEKVYVPQPIFVKHFQDFCRANGQPAQLYAWNQSVWETAFQQNHIKHGENTEEKS